MKTYLNTSIEEIMNMSFDDRYSAMVDTLLKASDLVLSVVEISHSDITREEREELQLAAYKIGSVAWKYDE